ncbi:MAG TPA: hypothetical protein VI794_02420 [Patescibacteria group bacterium]|nr:hypothetical protein [Patescibacteria group bacterium]
MAKDKEKDARLRAVLKKYREDARRLRKFSEFTPLNKVERMALDCFEALEEALRSLR